MHATDFRKTPIAETDQFAKEYRMVTRQVDVTEGDHYALVLVKTSAKLTPAQQTAFEGLINALSGGGISASDADCLVVATVPPAPRGKTLRAIITANYGQVDA